MPELVEAGDRDKVPTKTKVKLWHIGNQGRDKVSYGLEDATFQYPCCDIGGLTNCSQQLKSAPNFLNEKLATLTPDANVEMLAQELFQQWQALTERRVPDTHQQELQKWLISVRDEFKERPSVDLRFFRPPAEHRVMVTSQDVLKAAGQYYVRVFGGDSHARASD